MNTFPAPSRVLSSGLDASLTADDEEVFFASLQQSNGTTRMTRSGRLTDVNAAIAAHLPVASALETLDVGISSGISAVEWLLTLERIGRECAMTAFDRVLCARLYCAGALRMLAERVRTPDPHRAPRVYASGAAHGVVAQSVCPEGHFD